MKEIDWYMRRMVMKKKALILLTLCMVSLTACGTKESVKPVPATEQTAKAEPTEEVQEVTETQKQEVKKPEASNTQVIKGFRSRAVETANDDGTYDYKFYCQGKAPKTHEEYTIAYEIDNVPMRLKQTNFMGEYQSTPNDGKYIGLCCENIKYGKIANEDELANIENVTVDDLDDENTFVRSSFQKEDNTEYTKVFYEWPDESGEVDYLYAAIKDKATGEVYEMQYSLYGTWADKDKEIQNFRDTVKLIPFDESLFEE